MRSTGRVDLLSFGSAASSGTLRAALTGLGFTAETLGFEHWQPARPARPLILHLSGCCYPRDALRARLEELEAPRLGLFDGASFPFHAPVLRHCTDFMAWPAHPDELALRLRLAGVAQVGLDDGQRQGLIDHFARLNLLGTSPSFVRVLELVRRLAVLDAPVLIQGETGTGKELVARAIHYGGERHDRPFIPVNCGALPDNLVENELFGHERGAFTDAKGTQPGLVAQADGGTLFLDEVDVLSPKAQVALLRFLQDHEFRPLGAVRARTSDVRVLAASHAPLGDLVHGGSFRQDLAFRLDILQIRLPRLADRPGDVELLAHHFLRHYSGRYRRPGRRIHPQALAWLEAQPWPGNVRELENLVHRAFLIADGPVLELADVLRAAGEAPPSDVAGAPSTPFGESFQVAKARVVESFEKRYLTELLRETGGNVSLAARRAGKERRALGKLLKKYGIRRSRYAARRENG